MRKISGIIKHNRLYVVLFIFIIIINLLAFVDWVTERYSKGAETVVQEGARTEKASRPTEKGIFNEEDIKARQEKLKSLAIKDPLLYLFVGLLNLTILFVIFIGLILDVYILIRWVRREPFRIRVVRQDKPLWGIADVVRVTLIFLSCGYIFVILQGLVAEIFPILYNENFRMVFNTAVMNVIGIGVILYFIVKKYGQDLRAVGLSVRKFSNSVFYAVVGYTALIPVLLGIMVLTFFVAKLLEYRPPVQPIVQVFMEEKETAVLWFSALFAAVFGPIAEEVFFRGFMYTAIRQKLGIFRAMIVTSVTFSFLHAHIVGFLPIMALGLLLAYLYEKTGSLVAPISVHIMHNVGMVILVFLMRSIGT